MAGILDPGDSKVPLRLLNDVNDPAPGQVLASPSGSIVQPYYGQIGKRLVLTEAMASTLSDTAIGTLHEGIYQYVQVLTGATAAPVLGQLAYWNSASNQENGIVTTDQTATNCSNMAGVFLSAPSKGNYCWIQIAGLATMLFKSSITKVTPADGDLVLIDGSTSPRVDILADATNITSPTLKLLVGTCVGAASSNAASLVNMWHLRATMPPKYGF